MGGEQAAWGDWQPLFTDQCPPNGCGITALLALGIVEAFEVHSGIDVLDIEHNSALYLHILVEALKLAFADSKSVLAQYTAS